MHVVWHQAPGEYVCSPLDGKRFKKFNRRECQFFKAIEPWKSPVGSKCQEKDMPSLINWSGKSGRFRTGNSVMASFATQLTAGLEKNVNERQDSFFVPSGETLGLSLLFGSLFHWYRSGIHSLCSDDAIALTNQTSARQSSV